MRIETMSPLEVAGVFGEQQRNGGSVVPAVQESGAEADADTGLPVAQPTDDEAAEAAVREAEAKARMQVIRDYIETYGAPEEKDDEYASKNFLKRLQEEDDEKRKQGLPGSALKTWGDVIQDPEDEGEVHVYTVKTNEKGEGKITRHVKFDSGDGEDRSQLTAERARANRAYARGVAGTDTADKDGDEREDRRV